MNQHNPSKWVSFRSASTISREIWEIKPAKEAVKSDVLARTQFLSSALPRLGFTYHLVIGEELARKPRLTNALMLLKFGRDPIDLVEREHVRQLLVNAPTISWELAVNGQLGTKGKSIVSRLVLEGVLICEMDQPIVAQTQFSWVGYTDTAGG